MPVSPHSSRASATCRPPEVSAGSPAGTIVARVAWQPSRLLATALALLGLLAAGAVLGSEMPRAAALCLAGAASLHGIWLASRELARPSLVLNWDGSVGVVAVDGMPAGEARLRWRGPLAFLRWRDAQGTVHRLVFWPDVLGASQRRMLRLASGSGHPVDEPPVGAGQASGRVAGRALRAGPS